MQERRLRYEKCASQLLSLSDLERCPGSELPACHFRPPHMSSLQPKLRDKCCRANKNAQVDKCTATFLLPPHRPPSLLTSSFPPRLPPIMDEDGAGIRSLSYKIK
eukprot:766210-Hanusia_phi.AAC.4